MNGKLNAIGLTLLMIASALAGCTSGDPDGDGEMGIDTDMLNDLIEDNLQDFINNSSVTVHQEIHYHNNTTYVDNSESNMNVGGGSGANGSLSGSIMQVYRIQDSAPYQMEDFGNITLIQDGILQYPAIGIAPDLIYTIGSTTISLTLTCNEFYNAHSQMYPEHWRDWLRYERGLDSSDAYHTGEQIWYDMNRLADEADQYCMLDWGDEVYFSSEMLEIELLMGETMQFIDITGYWDYNISCDDGYFNNGDRWDVDDNNLLGGWSDCTFTIYQTWSVDVDLDSVYVNSSNYQTFNIPNWFTYSHFDEWRYIDSESGTAEHDSIIYFTKYFVVPLE